MSCICVWCFRCRMQLSFSWPESGSHHPHLCAVRDSSSEVSLQSLSVRCSTKSQASWSVQALSLDKKHCFERRTAPVGPKVNFSTLSAHWSACVKPKTLSWRRSDEDHDEKGFKANEIQTTSFKPEEPWAGIHLVNLWKCSRTWDSLLGKTWWLSEVVLRLPLQHWLERIVVHWQNLLFDVTIPSEPVQKKCLRIQGQTMKKALFCRMQATIDRLAGLLKPGGQILFRDYGKYDMTQLRFKEGSSLTSDLLLFLLRCCYR